MASITHHPQSSRTGSPSRPDARRRINPWPISFLFFLVPITSQCVNPIDPVPPPVPSLSAMNDTTITAPATIQFFADITTPTIPIRRFHWSSDGGQTFSDSTSENRITRHFDLHDTGVHVFVVFAQSAAGINSAPDTFRISVHPCIPGILLTGDRSARPGDTTMYSVASTTSCGIGPSVQWSLDGGTTFTSSDQTYSRIWSVADTGRTTIIAKATDRIGAGEISDTVYTTVVACRPDVRISIDSVMYVGQASTLTARIISSCEGISGFVWSWNTVTTARDTSPSPFMRRTWTPADTGERTISVKAILHNGIESAPAAQKVRILPSSPSVQLPGDTAVSINEVLVVKPNVQSPRPVRVYHLRIDENPVDLVSQETLFLVWPAHQAGEHTVRLRAENEDGILSDEDSMRVLVHLYAPRVTVPGDTVLSIRDTLALSCAAFDTNGTIEKYYWSFSGFGWSDSTDSASRTMRYQGLSPVRVIIGARDSDGLLAIDSLRVTFNQPPVVRMLSPASGDTVVYCRADTSDSAKHVRFTFAATDPEDSTPRVRFYLGAAPADPALLYEGLASSILVPDLDTGDYQWRLVAFDSYGDSAVATGEFTRMVRTTICFVGHSIVAGMAGDGVSGGFRKGVLDSLRANCGSKTIVRPVGPLVTPFMQDKYDDSCFALSGSTGPQMFSQFNAHADIRADIWVLMMGVNGNYAANEVQATLGFIRTFRQRSPHSKIRVINGLRYSDVNPWRYYYAPNLDIYNQTLADTLAEFRAAGQDAEVVDAYTAFTKDGSLDTTLMDQGDYNLHPNQEGYGLMTSLIASTLK